MERMTGRYPVVRLWKGRFIVLSPKGHVRAVGRNEANHNLLPVTAQLIEGEPLRVQSERIEIKGRSLRWLLGKIDQRRVYYLNGELQTGGV